MAHASFVLVMVGQAVSDGAAASLLTSARAAVVRRLRGISSSKTDGKRRGLYTRRRHVFWNERGAMMR